MNQAYYNASGKIAASFYLFFLTIMIVGIPALSNVYIYLLHYIPFVYLNFLFAAGCGFLLGYFVRFAVRLGKARSPIYIFVFTLAAACILKYVQWCVYIPMVVSEVYGFPMPMAERIAESLYYFVRPGSVFEAIGIINEYGTWRFSKTGPVTGPILHLVWTGEFLILIIFSVMASWKQPRYPYSEEAGDWYIEVVERTETDMPEDFGQFISQMENGDSDQLIQLAAAGVTDKSSFMRIVFFQPPEGSSTEPYYFSIERLAAKKGKPKGKVVANYMAIDRESALKIITGDFDSHEDEGAGDAPEAAAGAAEDDAHDGALNIRV